MCSPNRPTQATSVHPSPNPSRQPPVGPRPLVPHSPSQDSDPAHSASPPLPETRTAAPSQTPTGAPSALPDRVVHGYATPSSLLDRAFHGSGVPSALPDLAVHSSTAPFTDSDRRPPSAPVPARRRPPFRAPRCQPPLVASLSKSHRRPPPPLLHLNLVMQLFLLLNQ